MHLLINCILRIWQFLSIKAYVSYIHICVKFVSYAFLVMLRAVLGFVRCSYVQLKGLMGEITLNFEAELSFYIETYSEF